MLHGRRVLTLLAIAATAIGQAGCRGADPVSEIPSRGPIVLISIDTLRSDRLPAYGYRGVETPAIDELRADAILFERAYTPSPLTAPAHASIFTGQLPADHRLRDNSGYRLGEAVGPTLAERLRAAGYVTGAAVSAFVLRRELGLARGFDRYDDELGSVTRTALGDIQRSGPDTLAAALGWLATAGRSPFFLFLHLYEPHTPRVPPEPFASRYLDPYDGEVAAADAVVGRLVAELRAKGLYDRSTIVLLSDHGEGLGDHGEDTHGVLLYRESLQVPLLLKLPDGRFRGTALSTPVHLLDVAPTLLAIAGTPPKAGELPGTSLLELLIGSDQMKALEDRPLFAETYHAQLRLGWSGLTSIIRGRLHYIEGVDRELYDLIADPGEREDLIGQDRRLDADLRADLRKLAEPLEPPSDEESAEARKALAALGYLGGGPSSANGPPIDPKTKVHHLSQLRDAIQLVHDRRSVEAIPLLRRAIEALPRSIDAWQFLGVALQETAQPQAAFDAYQRAFELSHGAPHLAEPMARLALELGRWRDASAFLGLLLSSSTERREANLLLYSRALLFAGEVDRALANARASVVEFPESADAHYILGAALMAARDLAAAERALRRALELGPDHPGALSDLAVLLSSQARNAEARALLERLARLQPENQEIRRRLAQLGS